MKPNTNIVKFEKKPRFLIKAEAVKNKKNFYKMCLSFFNYLTEKSRNRKMRLTNFFLLLIFWVVYFFKNGLDFSLRSLVGFVFTCFLIYEVGVFSIIRGLWNLIRLPSFSSIPKIAVAPIAAGGLSEQVDSESGPIRTKTKRIVRRAQPYSRARSVEPFTKSPCTQLSARSASVPPAPAPIITANPSPPKKIYDPDLVKRLQPLPSCNLGRWDPELENWPE